MLLLAIDTAGTTGSVALARSDCDDGLPAVEMIALPGRAFSAHLIPAIDTLLRQNRSSLAALDGFVVVRGPGSFTGLRVGLSAVKALAEVTGKPVIALSRLAVMASMQPEASPIHALLDAGRGEFYSGLYHDAGDTCVRESLETAATLRTALRPATRRCLVAERSLATALQEYAPVRVADPTAAEALPLALRYWRRKQFADIALLDANYLRRSDAELFAKPIQPARLSPDC